MGRSVGVAAAGLGSGVATLGVQGCFRDVRGIQDSDTGIDIADSGSGSKVFSRLNLELQLLSLGFSDRVSGYGLTTHTHS